MPQKRSKQSRCVSMYNTDLCLWSIYDFFVLGVFKQCFKIPSSHNAKNFPFVASIRSLLGKSIILSRTFQRVKAEIDSMIIIDISTQKQWCSGGGTQRIADPLKSIKGNSAPLKINNTYNICAYNTFNIFHTNLAFPQKIYHCTTAQKYTWMWKKLKNTAFQFNKITYRAKTNIKWILNWIISGR